MKGLLLGSIQPRAKAHAWKVKRLPWPLLMSLVLWLVAPAAARAAAVLRDVHYSAMPDNQVRIELQLSEPIEPPRAFATENPARIALDLVGVTSGLNNKRVAISTGPVQSLVAVEASDRTRVVINLKDSVPYEVSTSGNRVGIDLNVPKDQTPPSQPPAEPASGPTASPTEPTAGPAPTPPAAPPTGGIQDIEFKRGPNGEGRVLIRLPSPGTRVSVTEKGRHVVAEIIDARLPPRLLRRLDVTDLATPVVAVEPRARGNDVEVDIETATGYEYLAYQADELFTLEFRPVTRAPQPTPRKKPPAYGGDRLSLNFQDIEVRAVLQLLADFTGINLVASDTVTGNITLRLKNVPWDQALEIILKSKGLSKRQTGNVIMVAPTPEIVAREEAEMLANQKVEELAPLRSEYMQVNYAKAQEIADLLKSGENQLLTPERGNVMVDERTNTLVVRDTARQLEDVRRLVARLDVPVRQVMIESRIVIANNDFARDLGVRFGLSKTNTLNVSADGTIKNKGFGEGSGGLPGYLQDSADLAGTLIQNPEGVAPLLVDLPAATPSGAVNLLLGKIGTYLLQLELSAMQREGRGEIVSSPRVITSDQHKATIKVGQEIPYQESSASGRTTVAFKEAVLQLEVTPQITPDDRVIMLLNVNKDNPDFTREVLGVPPVDTRSVETSVLVDNGETVVLGGVYERTKEFNKEQVPWLGDLPVIGNLFKTTNRRDNNTELLIFVTPKILKEGVAGR
jgi:type IV pilus assembly protein PilQ